MPVAEKPQHLQALERANERRFAAVAERRELRGAPIAKVVSAIVDPSESLAGQSIGRLFAPAKAGGLIERFWSRSLAAALAELSFDPAVPRKQWHSKLRLRELTRRERQLLMRAIVKRAPKAWRAAA